MARTTRASAKPPAAKRAKTKTESPWEDVVKPEKNDAKTEAASPSVVDVRDGRAIVVADATTTSPPSSGASPYPTLSRPTPEECWAARDALAHLHAEYYRDFLRRTSLGAVGPGADRGVPALPATPAIGGGGDANAAAVAAVAAVAAAGDADDAAHHPKCVLDSLVGTILSQNTTDVNSARAFARLAATFAPSRDGRGRLNFWETIRAAPSAEVEAAIKCGGLAEIKTSRIKVILNTLVEERGAPCMEYLRDMSDDDVKSELSRFKGVGPKTIACVLVFCLRRAEFPVDAHVWKIAMALGWVPKSASRDAAYEHLNRRVPDACKLDLHVLLVEHGKAYKNDVGWLRSAVREQLESGGTRWMESLETAGGVKAIADSHFRAKSLSGGVCGG